MHIENKPKMTMLLTSVPSDCCPQQLAQRLPIYLKAAMAIKIPNKRNKKKIGFQNSKFYLTRLHKKRKMTSDLMTVPRKVLM